MTKYEEPKVEPHPFHNHNFVLDGPAFPDGDDAPIADLLHGLRDDVVDMDIPVRGDRRDLGDLGGDGFCVGGEEHGVASGCNDLDAESVDGADEDGGGGCAVAGHLARLLYEELDEWMRSGVLWGISTPTTKILEHIL